MGLSLGQHPNCPLALLTLFFLFFREPIGKKRSGKDSFPLCWSHQLLLPATGQLSCCGARSHPIATQAPIPYPLSPCGAPQGGPDAHSSQHCPGGAVSTAGPPVHPLPASCLVSHPFVPHQGLSRERPLSCTEVLTAAPALALLCLSQGTPAHLGGRKLVTLARSCHIPVAFCGGWWTRGGGTGAGAWLWCSSTGRGCAPGPAAGLGMKCFRSSGECLSCLGGSVGLEVSWCSRMLSFSMAPAGSLGKVVGSGMLYPCSSGEGDISERPPCWCGLGLFELPKKSRREEWKSL